MSSSKEFLIAKKNLLRLNAQAKVDALMTDVMSVAKGETSRLNVVEPQAIDDHYMGVSDDE